MIVSQNSSFLQKDYTRIDKISTVKRSEKIKNLYDRDSGRDLTQTHFTLQFPRIPNPGGSVT